MSINWCDLRDKRGSSEKLKVTWIKLKMEETITTKIHIGIVLLIIIWGIFVDEIDWPNIARS